jgi:hypothetical protein
MAARTVIHAVVGGTASVASGGKFANGAVTAAMAFAYNEKSHPPEESDSPFQLCFHEVGEPGVVVPPTTLGSPSFPLGSYHGKIVVTPTDGAAWSNHPRLEGGKFYFGGGPDSPLSDWALLGALRGGVNRPKDVAMSSIVCHNLSLMSGVSETQAITRLFLNTERYDAGLKPKYTLIPMRADSHNSNSYIHGLGLASGLRMPLPEHVGIPAPGYSQPVPSDFFWMR